MPEGDTIFRLAETLGRALTGRRIVAAESGVVEVAVEHVIGSNVLDVASRGKHLLVDFSSGVTLDTHMMMSGRWRVHARGAPWRGPPAEMRVALATEKVEAVCFGAPIVRLLRTDWLDRDRRIARLGGDPLGEGFDPAAAAARLGDPPSRPIGVALLDQRAVAGVGNVFKSEVLFLLGADPFARAGLYPPDQLVRIAEVAAQLLRVAVTPILGRPPARRTRLTLETLRGRGEALWVYGRARQPCFVCGELVRAQRQGEEARTTYFCPRCQPRRASSDAPLATPRGAERILSIAAGAPIE